MGGIVALGYGILIGISWKSEASCRRFDQRYRQHRRDVRMALPLPKRSLKLNQPT
jgi:hypothetical protein